MSLLMTGGTGFLGLHLVREQVRAGRPVTLLAHAGSTPAFERVERFLDATGTLVPEPLDRLLSVVDVDVRLPLLGLTADDARVLALEAEELWHVAASVVLDGRDDHVWQSNVVGTENVLALADLMPAGAVFRHVSTAFVAGQVRQGEVREADTAVTTAFENTYEHSKHTAEGLVRHWAKQRDRSALVLRPSILVPGADTVTASPEHTLRTVSRIIDRIVTRSSTSNSRLVLRVGADPRAHLNLVQVDWAAKAMRMLGERVRTDVVTAHVVHDKDVPVRTISAALEDTSHVRLRMMPAAPHDPTDTESYFHRRAAGFLPYLFHRRHYDTSLTRRLLPGLPLPDQVDRDHLRRCFEVPAEARA
ncbi:MAG: NAD-dependent epimerase/dehydratase family protein [Saccharothrix sp.]|nr:NAD-dependent epimerase/dehydratase family protein [Saccharothrix sp.]